MTNRELIRKLLEYPMEMEVTYSAGADPRANLLVRQVGFGRTTNSKVTVLVIRSGTP